MLTSSLVVMRTRCLRLPKALCKCSAAAASDSSMLKGKLQERIRMGGGGVTHTETDGSGGVTHTDTDGRRWWWSHPNLSVSSRCIVLHYHCADVHKFG